jgi:hypothetical protein
VNAVSFGACRARTAFDPETFDPSLRMPFRQGAAAGVH